MKQTLLLLLVSLYSLAQNPTNGLVAQYGFNNGAVLVDDANGNNFTQTGTSLTEVNNRYGNPPTSAVSLNGDHLTRSDIDFPIDGLGYGNFETLSFWIKTTTNDSDTRIIIDDSNRTSFASSTWAGNYVYLVNGFIGAQLGVQYYQASLGYRSGGVLTNKFVSDGNWHHVAVLLSNSIGYGGCCTTTIYNSLSVYIDGVNAGSGGNSQSSTSSISLAQSHDTNGNITVGNNRSNSLPNNNRYFDVVDDILFYNRLLTPTEISDIANYNFCFAPDSTILSASAITQTSATINITGSNTYDIAYHKTSEPFANAIIVSGINTGSSNLTSLDVFTDYKVYVRRQCTSNTTGWSQPITFRTARTLGYIYVNQNAVGNNNGISWTNAYTSITDALAIAQNNEEIWIAEGVYTPHASDRSASFTVNVPGIKIYGGFEGTETQLSDRIIGAHETILSGDLLANDDNIISYTNSTRVDNSYTVVNILADNIELNGLTISGGHANGASGSATEARYGGGIHKSASTRNLTIKNCKVIKNVSKEAGGAISSGFGATAGTSSLTINGSEFSENLSAIGGAIYSASTGTSTVSYFISNSVFSKNKVGDINGAATGYAGSSMWLRAYNNSSTMISNIVNCTFVDNVDEGTASGMNNMSRVTLALTKNTSANHTATLSNSIFWNNKGLSNAVARPIGGFIESMIPSMTIKNSIDETNFTGVTLSGTSGNNSSSNPLFTNLSNGDYTLSNGSPAIDSGDNLSVIGVADLLGMQRIYNSTVDMGAYEYGATLGFNTNSFSDFSVFPNPTAGILNVRSAINIYRIEIYSLEGRKIKEAKNSILDISDLSSGIYLLKVKTEEGKFGTKKIIKN
ncbi:T9SS type A sorting domain-containing protein [Flavobacterium terrae]|uniref:Por secretion system C-terminal sorting domain-containing protein n=1 Tax=Flavobacterium terrae TaxID=415425 RepID=A0A1M6AS18_9FLAO|nr:T9SS type A sorting domain-containing protein [Flavobacterium terrae]SHI39217.1 Por secretion system C-terminal sorting domain-containing protein [Flavobacterium terrae]